MNLKFLSKKSISFFAVIFLLSLLFVVSSSSIFAATISFGKKVYTKVYVKSSSCVGCNSCVEVCPVKAIKIVNGKAVIDTTSCIGCLQCLKTCNYDALYRESK